MCNQNSCFGGSSCCWIIIAIILLFLFCGNGCGNGCGCGGNNGGLRVQLLRIYRALRVPAARRGRLFAGRSAIQPTSIKTMRTSTAF